MLVRKLTLSCTMSGIAHSWSICLLLIPACLHNTPQYLLKAVISNLPVLAQAKQLLCFHKLKEFTNWLGRRSSQLIGKIVSHVQVVCVLIQKLTLYYSYPTFSHCQSISVFIKSCIKQPHQGLLEMNICMGEPYSQLDKDFGFYNSVQYASSIRLISVPLYLMHDLFSICLVSLFQNNLFQSPYYVTMF